LNKYLDLSSFILSQLEVEQEIAHTLIERNALYRDRLHLPDILVDPQKKVTLCPFLPALIDNQLQKGYIPLSPGDILQYNLYQWIWKSTPWTHQAIYVGQGHIVELVRVQKARKPLGQITLRHISEMFTRGPKLQFISFRSLPTKMSRFEVIHRALQSVGYYRYSICYFNCHNAILTFFEETEIDQACMSNAVYYSLGVILSFILLIFVLGFLGCRRERRKISKGIQCCHPVVAQNERV
jgi:hypothetical protein